MRIPLFYPTKAWDVVHTKGGGCPVHNYHQFMPSITANVVMRNYNMNVHE